MSSPLLTWKNLHDPEGTYWAEVVKKVQECMQRLPKVAGAPWAVLHRESLTSGLGSKTKLVTTDDASTLLASFIPKGRNFTMSWFDYEQLRVGLWFSVQTEQSEPWDGFLVAGNEFPEEFSAKVQFMRAADTGAGNLSGAAAGQLDTL
jgi:hypothetical protein